MRGHLAEDLVGRRFGRLTVIEKAPTINRTAMWLCRCDCGDEKVVRGNHLRSGAIKSCGCLGLENATKAKITHGASKSRLYGVWNNMKNRCENPNVRCFKNYGGRGIKVCEEWRNSFSAFKAWADQTGYDENAPYMQCTIDRIDVNRDYEPSNCRWVNAAEQARNRRPRKAK